MPRWLRSLCVPDRYHWRVRRIPSGAEVDALDGRGCSPLHLAAACGHDLLVKTLFQHGADVNRPGPEGTCRARTGPDRTGPDGTSADPDLSGGTCHTGSEYGWYTGSSSPARIGTCRTRTLQYVSDRTLAHMSVSSRTVRSVTDRTRPVCLSSTGVI